MGRTAVVLAMLGLACLSLPSSAQDVSETKTWVLTAGAFIPTDGALCGADTETGFTLALSHKLSATEKNAWFAQLRYTRYDVAGDQYVELYSPMLAYVCNRWSPLYLTVALGTVIGSDNTNGNTWSAGYEVGIGWKASSSVRLEARWISGTKQGERGVGLSAGIAF